MGSILPFVPAHDQWSAQELLAAMVCSRRYQTDFEELQFLGRGGFGAVFKTQHRIDRQLYAVKRITIPTHWFRDANKISKLIREVRVLASNKHKHIVRYHQSWIEAGPPQVKHLNPSAPAKALAWNNNTEPTVDVEDNTIDNTNDCTNDNTNDNPTATNNNITEGSAGVWLSTQGETENTNDVSWQSVPNQLVVVGNKGGLVQPGDSLLSPSMQWYLYIQTELCQGKTLHDHLQTRERVDAKFSLAVAQQLLQALHFLHSRGAVHRDVKPSNIFFGDDDLVRLGDFGLSVFTESSTQTFCTEDEPTTSDSTNNSSSTTKAVGTIPYASPEQLQRQMLFSPVSSASTGSDDKGMGVLSSATDLYSFGMVLLELFFHTSTAMERAEVLSAARRVHGERTLPKSLQTNFPEIALVIGRCLRHNPEDRPTAESLLCEEGSPFRAEWTTQEAVVALQKQLADKDAQIVELERRLREHGMNPNGP